MAEVILGALIGWCIGCVLILVGGTVHRSLSWWLTEREIRRRGAMPTYRSYADQWHITYNRHKGVTRG